MFKDEFKVPKDEINESWQAMYRHLGVNINPQIYNIKAEEEEKQYIPPMTLNGKDYTLDWFLEKPLF